MKYVLLVYQGTTPLPGVSVGFSVYEVESMEAAIALAARNLVSHGRP